MTGAENVPTVTAVVVNWNTVELLDWCLGSLVEQAGNAGPLQVVVVDNGSDDGSAEHVRRAWPDVELIANDDNRGYTVANNQGLALARGTYVLLLNTDAALEPGCLDALVARLDSDPGAGVVGPRLTYGDGRWQRWTAGREPRLPAVAAYHLLVDRTPWGARRGLYLGADVTEAFCPDWVSSACLLVRRTVLEQLGGLDERLFCYMDDVDLGARARAAGWRVWYEPSAQAVHLMGQSTTRRTGRSSPAALRSFHRYYARTHGRSSRAALRAVEATGFGLRAAAYAGAGAVRRDPSAWAASRGHWQNLSLSLERVRD